MDTIDIKGFDNISQFAMRIKENLDNKQKILENIGRYVVDSIIKKFKEQNFKMGKPTSDFTKSLRRGSGGGKTLLDDGNLMKSISMNVVGDSIFVGSNLKYAKIQNEGGVINATKKYLYIPSSAEIKRLSKIKGVSETINSFKNKGYNVFYKKTNDGYCLFYQKQTKRKESPVKVMFYLKKSVEIPKREYLYLTDQDEKEIQKKIINNIFKGG